MKMLTMWRPGIVLLLAVSGCSLPTRQAFRDRPEILSLRKQIVKPSPQVLALASPRLPDGPESTESRSDT